jgi:single-stranded DNA-binding protein
MNNVSLFGTVDCDPELRGVPGRDVCELWIVVQGPRDKRPLHVKVVAFRGLAEDCVKHLRRGNQLAVTGSLRSDKFDPKNGHLRQFVHSVIAREIQFVEELSRDSDGPCDDSVGLTAKSSR